MNTFIFLAWVFSIYFVASLLGASSRVSARGQVIPAWFNLLVLVAFFAPWIALIWITPQVLSGFANVLEWIIHLFVFIFS